MADANRARRRRQTGLNPQQQQDSQVGRQYYSAQNQYGSQGLNYYPYSGVGAGSQYGVGQCK